MYKKRDDAYTPLSASPIWGRSRQPDALMLTQEQTFGFEKGKKKTHTDIHIGIPLRRSSTGASSSRDVIHLHFIGPKPKALLLRFFSSMQRMLRAVRRSSSYRHDSIIDLLSVGQEDVSGTFLLPASLPSYRCFTLLLHLPFLSLPLSVRV